MKNIMKKSASISLAVLMLMSLSGCDQLISGVADGIKNQDITSTENLDGLSPETVDYTKYNSYTSLNEMVYGIDSFMYYYDILISPDAEFAIADEFTEDDILYLYQYDSELVTDYGTAPALALEYSSDEPSYPSIDALINKTATACDAMYMLIDDLQLMALTKTSVEAFDYDKASEIHTKLMAEYPLFIENTEEFISAYEILEAEVYAESLEQQLANNELISYHSNVTLDLAYAIDDAIWATFDEDTNEFSVTLADLQPLIDDFNTNCDAFLIALEDPEQQKLVANVNEGVFNAFGGQTMTAEDVRTHISGNYLLLKSALEEVSTALNNGEDVYPSSDAFYVQAGVCIDIHNNYLLEIA